MGRDVGRCECERWEDVSVRCECEKWEDVGVWEMRRCGSVMNKGV